MSNKYKLGSKVRFKGCDCNSYCKILSWERINFKNQKYIVRTPEGEEVYATEDEIIEVEL